MSILDLDILKAANEQYKTKFDISKDDSFFDVLATNPPDVTKNYLRNASTEYSNKLRAIVQSIAGLDQLPIWTHHTQGDEKYMTDFKKFTLSLFIAGYHESTKKKEKWVFENDEEEENEKMTNFDLLLDAFKNASTSDHAFLKNVRQYFHSDYLKIVSDLFVHMENQKEKEEFKSWFIENVVYEDLNEYADVLRYSYNGFYGVTGVLALYVIILFLCLFEKLKDLFRKVSMFRWIEQHHVILLLLMIIIGLCVELVVFMLYKDKLATKREAAKEELERNSNPNSIDMYKLPILCWLGTEYTDESPGPLFFLFMLPFILLLIQMLRWIKMLIWPKASAHTRNMYKKTLEYPMKAKAKSLVKNITHRMSNSEFLKTNGIKFLSGFVCLLVILIWILDVTK